MLKYSTAILLALCLLPGCKEAPSTSNGENAAVPAGRVAGSVDNIAEFPGLDRACLVVTNYSTVVAASDRFTLGEITRQMLKGSEAKTAQWEKIPNGYLWRVEKVDHMTKETNTMVLEFVADDSAAGQQLKAGNLCGPTVMRASRAMLDGQQLEGHAVSLIVFSIVKQLTDAQHASAMPARDPNARAEPIPLAGGDDDLERAADGLSFDAANAAAEAAEARDGEKGPIAQAVEHMDRSIQEASKRSKLEH